MFTDIVRVLVPAWTTFFVGFLIAPVIIHYLYKYKAWKKKAGKIAITGEVATEFSRLHKDIETRAPRMGGIVIWAGVLLTITGFSVAAVLFPASEVQQFNFLSRSQTWIPLCGLLVGAVAGLVDDLLMVSRPDAQGLPLWVRLSIVILLSGGLGWWFWAKLAVTAINIPFGGFIVLGWFIIPFFVLLSLAVYASGVIDGIDGLSGGVFGTVFAAYAIIAYAQSQTDLASFCASVAGGIMAFLWFNIPPARFYMTDTGTMALTLALSVVVFMTDSLGGGVGITVFPIIGFLLVATVASNILQVFWKKVFKRKLFRVAPLHHHFEAIGWPGYKVAMRYWVIAIVFAFMGVIVALSALHA